MDPPSEATQRNLNPSAEEFHPTTTATPNYHQSHTFAPHVLFFNPPTPLQQHVYIPYHPFIPPPAAYFHQPPPSSSHVQLGGQGFRANYTIPNNNNVFQTRGPMRTNNTNVCSIDNIDKNDSVFVNSDRPLSRNKPMDWRFMVRDNNVTADGGDLRTTLMIKNIPNKYSLKLLMSMLDNHCAHNNDLIIGGRGEGTQASGCLSSYDFVYLPMDFNNKCNVGYGFVNMTSPEATIRLYKAFHGQSWEIFNSHKICEVTYARIQGLQALKDHFRNTKFPSESEDEIFPVVFDPPRDGRHHLTPQQPIYGLVASSSDNGTDEFGNRS